MFDFINNIDFELIKVIITFFVSIIVLNIFWKILRKHRFIRVIIVGVVLTYIIFNIVSYVDKKNKIYSSDGYYVYGVIKRIDSSNIEINSTRTNFPNNGEGIVYVVVKNSTILVDSTNKDNLIKRNDLKEGYTIQVYTNSDNPLKDDNNVEAKTIILKSKK